MKGLMLSVLCLAAGGVVTVVAAVPALALVAAGHTGPLVALMAALAVPCGLAASVAVAGHAE